MKQFVTEAIHSAIFLLASLALLLGCLYWGGYLLFHTLVELFVAVVLVGTFVVAWNTRRRPVNGYLMFFGMASLFIAVIGLMHALVYRGMNIVPGLHGANEATQLWIAAMGMKAITLVVAPFFVGRRVPAVGVGAIYALVTIWVLTAVLYWENLPACFVEGQGLTPFKIAAEYVIMGLLVVAVGLWWRVRAAFSPKVRGFIIASLVANIATEVLFTTYAQPEDKWNITGHILLVVAYYFSYRAIVQTGLAEPFELLLGDLQKREQELHQTIAELNRARTQAEHASRAKGQFLAVLSHELRTPLTPVLASVSDHLAGGDVPPHLQETFRMIHRNIELQTRLVDDLLDLTRVDRGKIRVQRSPVDVNPIIRHAVGTQRGEFARKGIHLTVHTDAEHTWLSADSPRIEQVIWNLLSNARKFTPAGGHVQLATRNEMRGATQMLIIEVTDTGVGIEPSEVTRIFEPFEQAHEQSHGGVGGLGLGLAISRAMVRLHEGEITASSDGLGSGARFSVRLPTIAKPADVEAPAAYSPPPAAGVQCRILLVEDHRDTARVIGQLLRREGHEVAIAHDIAAATDLFLQGEIDLVISDIGLPDGNGVDMLRLFRERSPQTPAICMSGFGTEEDQRASTDAGSVCHLVKPVTIQRLRGAIAQAMATVDGERVLSAD